MSWNYGGGSTKHRRPTKSGGPAHSQSADGSGVGPPGSAVQLRDAWQGRLPPTSALVEVVGRSGCDTAPLDPRTTEGRLHLTSYVWPDQTVRLERLRAALALAADLPFLVRRTTAATFLADLDLAPGATTVLWHSVMWQYLSGDEQRSVRRRIDELGARAGDTSGFAHLALEPRRPAPGVDHVFQVRLRVWPGGDEQVLGIAEPHGIPTTWE